MLTSSHFATLPLLISEKPLLFYLPCKNLLKRVYLGQLHRTVGREMLAARPDDLSSVLGPAPKCWRRELTTADCLLTSTHAALWGQLVHLLTIYIIFNKNQN